MNNLPGGADLSLNEAYSIGWLEETWLKIRAGSVFEEELIGRGSSARARGGPIGTLADSLSARRGAALLELRATIAEVRRGSRAGRRHLVEYVEAHQDHDFFFAAIADLERCFGLNRYAGRQDEVRAILDDLRHHAVRVGDQPVAAQLVVPPDALNVEVPLSEWKDMLGTLDRIHAKARLRGELRLRMLARFGPRLPARQRIFHGIHAARELRDAPHKRAHALGFARDGYLDTKDFERAAKISRELDQLAAGHELGGVRRRRSPGGSGRQR